MAEIPTSVQAVTMCSLTTLLGFGSLIFSHTPAVRSLGVLLGVGIIGCWAAAILVLLPLAWRATAAKLEE